MHDVSRFADYIVDANQGLFACAQNLKRPAELVTKLTKVSLSYSKLNFV